MRCTGVLPRGCRVPSSRAGGAVRTGPRGPRPFSRFRICLSGNPAPPQDGVGPGAQAAPGTAPSHQAPRPSCQPPPQGNPGRGSEPLTPGACGLYHWVLIRGDAGSEGLSRCARPGSEGDPRLWEEQRAAIAHRDHLSWRSPSRRGEASPSSSGSFALRDSRKPLPVWSGAQCLHLRNGHADASGWVQLGRTRKVDHLLQPWSSLLAE